MPAVHSKSGKVTCCPPSPNTYVAVTEQVFQRLQSSSVCITLTFVCCRTPGALSVNAIKVQSNGSLAGGLITGVSGMSTASFDSTQPIKAGVEQFNSDGTPRASMTPRASSYLAPESARAERSSDSQNRASLLGVKLQPLNVEPSGGSLLSPGSSKKVCSFADQTTCLPQMAQVLLRTVPRTGFGKQSQVHNMHTYQRESAQCFTSLIFRQLDYHSFC